MDKKLYIEIYDTIEADTLNQDQIELLLALLDEKAAQLEDLEDFDDPEGSA